MIAAEITADAGDFSHLRPMITAALLELENAGIEDTPEVAVADAQYWNEQHMDDVISEHAIQMLIPPDSGKRKGERPGWTGGRYSFMRRVLATDHGRETYRKRQKSIEPVFGHTKHNRKFTSFHRRGRPSGADRVAINHDESQPHQAPPQPNSHREGLKKGPRDRHNAQPAPPGTNPGQRRAPAPIPAALRDSHRGKRAGRTVPTRLSST